MKTLQLVVDLVESQAAWLVSMGRLGYRALDESIDWIDTNLGALFLKFILDRYAELVSAGQEA